MAKSKKQIGTPAKKASGKSQKRVEKKVSKPAASKIKPLSSKKASKTPASKPVLKKIEVKKAPIGPIQKKKKGTGTSPKLIKPVPNGKHPRSISRPKGRDKAPKTRYSDAELAEFRQLIIEKVEAAKKELKYLQDQISRSGDNTADDTENKYNAMDDGGSSMEREYLNQMAARQRMYLDHLDKALVRIQNKTYGICRVTGKLIDKERLRAVPHATLSMEAKMNQQHPQPNINV
ncbi:MAG: TraR/DksA C4-type zinc finger protein [Chitinophagales bacterium]